MMDDNSAILELITEFLVSKNLLHTAQTLQHEWVGLYPGHSFPDINNLLENFATAIPVEPPHPPGQYMYPFQSSHQNNMARGGDMEDGESSGGNNTDEPMNEEDDEGGEGEGEGDEGEEGEVEEEIAEQTEEKGGEAEDDAVSVDSAYSRILVEDITEIMDEIAIDEEDMAEGEIDPLANEASPSEESESEMDEGENEDAGDEAEYEEEGEEGDEGDTGEVGEDEDEEGEDDEREQEEEEEEEEEDKPTHKHHRTSHSPSPTRGVIESVTELLGQHIQSQRDEFYQEEEGTTDAVVDKDLGNLELAALTINDNNNNVHTDATNNADNNNTNTTNNDNDNNKNGSNGDQQDATKSHTLPHLDTDNPNPELRGYECDVTIVNYDNKKSGAMFSPLISPTPHSPTPVLSPGVFPSMRSPSATLLPHSRSALYKRDPSSPLGKKHVQITSDSAPVSRSNSNLSARHITPPPSSPSGGRARISISTPSTPTPLTVITSSSETTPQSQAPTTPTSLSGKLPLPTSPLASSTVAHNLPPYPTTPTPATPPPPYSLFESTSPTHPLPNGITKSASSSSADKGNSNSGEKTAGGRRLSLEGKSTDVVMRDISYEDRPPFSYPVLVDGTTYDCFNLKIVHVKNRTGFESTKDFPIKANTLVAGRYQILEFLDSAAFSKAIRALDLHSGNEVCMKIIKNNKDYVDQSLDEIKLLKYLNSIGDPHKYNILQLYDFFYYKEHLFIVTELLRENLYEFYKYTNENGHPPYFTIPRLQKVALQCLSALEFIHGLDIIHTDLKPENILIKSYSRCEIKIIDFGSSCFTRDHLGSYVQSRDYRAVEVILGLPYSAKIDIWSLGCILAELFTGKVLFVNRSLVTLLARVSALVGPIPPDMIAKGRFSHKFFTKYHSLLYERDEKTGQYLIPLKDWLKSDDEDFVDFIQCLLSLRPDDRPTAKAALQHKWLRKVYPPI